MESSKLFGLSIFSAEFIVPDEYSAEQQVTTFVATSLFQIEKDSKYFLSQLFGKALIGVSDILISGKKYKVEIFPTLDNSTSSEIKAKLQEKGSLFCGFEGLTLLCQLFGEKLHCLGNNWVHAFSAKNYVADDGYEYVPAFSFRSNPEFGWTTYSYAGSEYVYKGTYHLCITKV